MSFTAPGYPHLSFSQLEEVWIKAGGSRNMAPLMAAIALAESGGWAGATNPTDNKNGTQTSWGLWQISNGTHSSPAPAGQNVYDPLTNAKLAVQKLHSQGLGAWGTYTSGAYRQYYTGNPPSPSTGAIPKGSGSTSATATDFTTPNSPGSVLQDLGGIIGLGSGGTLSWLTKNPLRTADDAYKMIGQSLHVVADVFIGMLWLFNPANQLRVLSGTVGLIILAAAIYLVATA